MPRPHPEVRGASSRRGPRWSPSADPRQPPPPRLPVLGSRWGWVGVLAVALGCAGDDDKGSDGSTADSGGEAEPVADNWYSTTFQDVGPLMGTVDLVGAAGACTQVLELEGWEERCDGCDFAFDVQTVSSVGDCRDAWDLGGVLEAQNDQMYLNGRPIGAVDELYVGWSSRVAWTGDAEYFAPYSSTGEATFSVVDITYR